MKKWKKEFMGFVLEGNEPVNEIPVLKINGQGIDISQAFGGFASPKVFGIFDNIEDLGNAIVVHQNLVAHAIASTVVIRRDAALLDTSQRKRFTDALLRMHDQGTYQTLAKIHANGWDPGHRGPAFFPWHRVLLQDFELAMQEADRDLGNDGNIALPYWNWARNNDDNQGNSLVFSDDLLGGNGDQADGGKVKNGPYKDWGLTREFDSSNLQFTGDPSAIMQIRQYQDDPPGAGNGFRSRLEFGPHGAAHMWLGGAAMPPATTANDPAFWLLHCNIDRLWAQWQSDRRADWLAANPNLPYPEEQQTVDYFWDGLIPETTWKTTRQPSGHNLKDSMWPWNGQGNNPLDDVSMEPWNQPGMLEERTPLGALNHARMGFVYDAQIGWSRVKEILDGIVNAWTQQHGHSPHLGRHGAGFKFGTKAELLAAEARFGRVFRLIEPTMIGTGQGAQTNLVISLKADEGVQGFGRMPLDGPYLPDYEIEEIRLWIDEGCPD